MQRNLIESWAVDDERLIDCVGFERQRDPPQHLRIGHSQQLDRWARRVDAWSQQVHHRAHMQLAANEGRVFHARVIVGRKQKAEAGLVEGLSGGGGIDLDPGAKGF